MTGPSASKPPFPEDDQSPAVRSAAPPAPETVKPRDAATLVIVDDEGGSPKILMGRRAAGHIFMPGRIVFPGGRIDPADLSIADDFDLTAETITRLAGSACTADERRRATALALAAIRETYEETGALIGAPGPFASADPVWDVFQAKGLRPTPERLMPFARALTPVGPPRRYDTRFFCVARSALAVPPTPDDLPSDELEAVGWFGFEETADMSLAPITRKVLAELKKRLDDGTWLDSSLPMPSYRRDEDGFKREMI